MILYFPGGWLADRYSPRKLITFSMISTGLLGLYFASFPSYMISILVHVAWGASCTLTFWSAMIRSTRHWATDTEQGRAFGFLESGRGISELGASTAFLAVFAWLGSVDGALSWVIILLSLTNLGLGLMAWLVLEDTVAQPVEIIGTDSSQQVDFRTIFNVLKLPVVWLTAVVILAAYSAYWGSFYFTPYATDVFLMSVVFGGAIGVGKMWLKPLAAVGAGFLGDKIGISRTIAWSFAVLIVSFSLFAFTPGNPGLVLILVANTAVASTAVFALRGIYYALLEEGGIPGALTGTVAGFVSVIGFTPDVFMPIVGGVLLDRYPAGTGYRVLFGFIAVLCSAGLVASLKILRLGKRPAIRQPSTG
jgi:MFS family permease